MVNSVSSPASKLIEQIKRLSTEPQKNEGVYLNHNNVINNRSNDIKDLRTLEKIQKKVEISTQMIEDIKKENKDTRMRLQDVPKQADSKKKYREPVGGFLDVYL